MKLEEPIVDAIQKIKDKAISDFLKLLQRANLGHYDDYLHILLEITFINTGAKLDNPTTIYERLLSL